MADPRSCRICSATLTKPPRGPWPTYCGVRCRRAVEFARRQRPRLAETIEVWRPLLTPDQLREMKAELVRLTALAQTDNPTTRG